MAKTVLVTGASGFLASYVIAEFFKAGWNQCDADALTYIEPFKDFIDPAVKGTLRVLEAAKGAGVKRVVVISSFAAVTNFKEGGPWRDYTYTGADWNPLTVEDCLVPDVPGPVVYSASKTLADRAAHDYAAKNDLILCTINPPVIYGPPLQRVASRSEINTSSGAIYALINGDAEREVPSNRLPLFAHVKDVAVAHAIVHLSWVHPSLAPRLPKLPPLAHTI
ncbi:NAD-dependent epimerase/dehydratase [Rhodotorula toruloides]|uniref:NAD-dependent epimerase/dehydratase n=1 Tax=Rhodotorula toruloides TaxID=5286 RepID=A0A511K9N7_RHOTO|nr:NAD-dependent epimerase/dehydratase [Rhodotorula toruloides]